MNRLLPLCSLALITTLPLACALPFDVGFTGRHDLEPRPEFFVWYWMTEECSGISGDARRVRWFSAAQIVTGSSYPVANWSEPHEITIQIGFERNSFVVRHESLHDLLDGDPLHDDSAWDRCRLRRVDS